MQNVHHCSHKQVCEHRVIIYSICCLCCIFSHSVVHYQHTQVIHNMAAFCIYNVSCLHQPVLLNTSSEAGDTNYCVQWRVMIDRLGRVYFERGVQPKCGVQNEKCGVQD